MARTIRFHLDENCDPRIASGLRLLRIDVTTAADAGLLHASDAEHLAFGMAENRIILTQDTDFLRIASTSQAYPGIFVYPCQGRSIGQVIRAAHLFWEVCEPEELTNQVQYI